MAVELEHEKKVLSEFLRSIGDWNKHIIIGGGYALVIYKLYLAAGKTAYPPVGTTDLDSLIPRKITGSPAKDLSKHLTEAGFKLIFRDLQTPPTEVYRKKVNGLEIDIEFLTDDAVRNNKNTNVSVAGIIAQPLSYLKLSLQNGIPFTTSTHETGFVVSPGTWMFHKGLTFPKRPRKTKAYKDLYGIWYAGSQLGSFSQQAEQELAVLSLQHATWFDTFQNNLTNWLSEATPEDWSHLQDQDPFDQLTKPGFEYFVQDLLKNIEAVRKDLNFYKILTVR